MTRTVFGRVASVTTTKGETYTKSCSEQQAQAQASLHQLETSAERETDRCRTMRSLSTNAVEDPRSAPFHLCQPGTHPGDALFVERLRMARPDEFEHVDDAQTIGEQVDDDTVISALTSAPAQRTDSSADKPTSKPAQPAGAPGSAEPAEHLARAQPAGAPGSAQPAESAQPTGSAPSAESAERFEHQPVMLHEVVAFLADVPSGVVVDATLGAGGHAAAILASRDDLKVLGLDRDANAVTAAKRVLAAAIEAGRARISNRRFDEIATALDEHFPGERVVGVLFDLGVSSPQLDWATRGFSYRAQGPLDMRMDEGQSLRADDVVNGYELDELTRVLRDGGEEKFARRVAKALVDARPIRDTLHLAEVIRSAIPAPARRRPGDPAKRTFQAIRIEVNDELAVLQRALDTALGVVRARGRVVTIAYHSGEDKIIKQRFIEASTGGCTCPPALPCVCGARPSHRILTKGARKPSEAEISANPRAQSARLRVSEALDVDETGSASVGDGEVGGTRGTNRGVER